MKYYLDEPYSDISFFNAGYKARLDIACIAEEMGFCSLKLDVPCVRAIKVGASRKRKLLFSPVLYWVWFKTLKQLHRGDILLVQIPFIYGNRMIIYHLLTAKKRGVKIIAFLHDIAFLRSVDGIEKINWKSFKCRCEVRLLECCDMIIVHNHKMKKFMTDHVGIDAARLIVHSIFDYLSHECQFEERVCDRNGRVVFAGNLSERKSGFLRDLPSQPDFDLYGPNFHEKNNGRNVHYHGVFRSEELPKVVLGNYGLVWDGNSCSTCSGPFGHYLVYNNPHKTSLYLSLGLPVIIWKEAALTDFVLEHGCGITVNSLDELSKTLESINMVSYAEMKNAAKTVGLKLRSGFYTRRVLSEILSSLD